MFHRVKELQFLTVFIMLSDKQKVIYTLVPAG